jgi:hypothetical protein
MVIRVGRDKAKIIARVGFEMKSGYCIGFGWDNRKRQGRDKPIQVGTRVRETILWAMLG